MVGNNKRALLQVKEGNLFDYTKLEIRINICKERFSLLFQLNIFQTEIK